MGATGQRHIDLAWSAGILDGEGCFSIAPTGSSPCITMDSTSKVVVDEFHRLFGGTPVSLKRKTEINRRVYRWSVYGPSAVEICKEVIPYLRDKGKQAVLMTKFNLYPPRSEMRLSIIKRLKTLKRITL